MSEEPKPGKLVDSTSDKRTVNNTMRHKYRVLDDTEKAYMQMVKDQGLGFLLLLHAIGNKVPPSAIGDEPTPPEGAPQKSRELANAATRIEEAVMWAVKHVAK